MSDFVWYSRLAVWAGAAVLLVQAVTGRSAGVVTVLAVLILAGGFVAFLAGLMWPAERALVLAGKQMEGPDRPGDVVAGRLPSPMEEVAPPDRHDVASPPLVRGTVHATEVEGGSGEVALICPGCGRPTAEGEVVVRCFRCGTVQHAACWTENRFHCAAAGCQARGGVEAPD